MQNVDYTNALNQYKMQAGGFNQIMQPVQRATPLSAIAKMLGGYFASKGMQGSQQGMVNAETDRKDQRLVDLSQAMGAYRGDTPYQPSEDELFPGEAPIEGLRDIGTGQDRMAMAQSMMGSGTESFQNMGLAMIGKDPNSQMGKYQPGNYTPQSWAEFTQSRNPNALKQKESRLIRSEVGNEVNYYHPITGELVNTETVGIAPKDTAAHVAEVAEEKFKKELEWKARIASSVKEAEALAVENGVVLNDYNRATAAMPGLLEAVAELKELAGIATSTIGGKIWDLSVRETGFGATEGANAKAKFIAIVNNQVLPLLKPTFGAAFTVAEGESLKATMGDPNATPAEKMSQLDAFIEQKYRTMATNERQIKAGAASKKAATDEIDFSLMSDEELKALAQ